VIKMHVRKSEISYNSSNVSVVFDQDEFRIFYCCCGSLYIALARSEKAFISSNTFIKGFMQRPGAMFSFDRVWSVLFMLAHERLPGGQIGVITIRETPEGMKKIQATDAGLAVLKKRFETLMNADDSMMAEASEGGLQTENKRCLYFFRDWVNSLGDDKGNWTRFFYSIYNPRVKGRR
jgi:hypothetical protein